jgi:hypothetical protein
MTHISHLTNIPTANVLITAANTITFNFSAAIKDGSFTVDDIGVTNGTINSGSFTKVSETQYTVMVTPSLGGKHSNVGITVAANTFKTYPSPY